MNDPDRPTQNGLQIMADPNWLLPLVRPSYSRDALSIVKPPSLPHGEINNWPVQSA
jgi:hypothetical protein